MSQINMTDLTTMESDGTGVFDELLDRVSIAIEREYSAGRITGSDFSKVYLGVMQSVLAQSTAFLLAKEKAGYEADLVAQQVKVAEQEVLNAQKQNQLIDQQILQMQAEVKLTNARADQVAEEVLNLKEQRNLIIAEVSLAGARERQTDQETAKLVIDTQNASKEGNLIDARKLLTDAQELEVDQRVVNMAAEKLKTDQETILVQRQAANAQTQNTTLVRQQEKLVAEKELLVQKKVTEDAQTNTGSYTGIVGAQRTLYERQADGFLRDAEQKAAKIMADTWNVRRSTDSGTSANVTNKLDDANVGDAIAKLLAGVNA